MIWGQLKYIHPRRGKWLVEDVVVHLSSDISVYSGVISSKYASRKSRHGKSFFSEKSIDFDLIIQYHCENVWFDLQGTCTRAQ